MVSFSIKNLLKGKAMNRKKLLIVYYSRSGSTRHIANMLAEKLDADLFGLETIHTYPISQKDIDAAVNRELENRELPELKALPDNLSGYDLIVSGGPVWMYTIATPVMQFLSKTDFAGLPVAPFCTHLGGPGRYFAHFRQQAVNARVLEGTDFYDPLKNEGSTLEKLDAWINKLSAA